MVSETQGPFPGGRGPFWDGGDNSSRVLPTSKPQDATGRCQRPHAPAKVSKGGSLRGQKQQATECSSFWDQEQM